MCMNTFKKCMECSADKAVIHFKLAEYKNCNIFKFIAREFFLLSSRKMMKSFLLLIGEIYNSYAFRFFFPVPGA